MEGKRPIIGIDIKLKHYQDPATGKIVNDSDYQAGFAFRDRYEVFNRYVDSVYEFGGLPLLIPDFEDEEFLKEYVAMSDAVLFVGLNDYPPSLYREPRQIETGVQPTKAYKRHAASNMILARLVLEENKSMPALGICAGPELFNIALGGKLVQHLATAKEHIAFAVTRDMEHEVKIVGGKILSGLFGKGRIMVNSNHHQAAHPDFIGRGLVVAAVADDGVVEAIESAEDRFLLGVQWHPERIRFAEHREKIFKAFISAAIEYRANR
ncbi:MAG TPA: gamma-glutamyl-gamma-aminobutyrate hydrolase family protein [bacterium]|nr:gamma-glutamyl-gamma-aminobutyrate hydrolase family protein [bacterium]